MAVFVLRLDHRSRDKRLTTHCALIARAFGSRGMYYTGERDESVEKSVAGVARNWGGSFFIRHVPSWKSVFRNFDGKKAHLTMYGMPFAKKIGAIRKARGKLLVVVGGSKVPAGIYGACDWNVGVTDQPHSEAGALAVFLNALKLRGNFGKARLHIIPQERGKKIEERGKV
ncbi:tRNA (cytidine(56)-2'-O)-methyltransferase [Candidatus Micrarchaeota archaeon CG08_land_8_20_14_0_20_59_11]|nr:MAG: tRNA (cytidine(56)-2'-O)-methyltransferase [Candidatus Micrarchaeota archaeon CG08_land_8_20_14_0_20_59_11]